MKAFTLIEALLVLSLLTFLAAFALVNGIDVYDRGLARTDRTLLLAALREARTEAMNGTCTNSACIGPAAHGIFISQSQITIFEGNSYASRYVAADETLPFSEQESVSGSASGQIVFAPDTGDVSLPALLEITGLDHHTEKIQVNTQGGITESFL